MEQIIYFSPIIFIIMWTIVTFIISKMGWSDLARKYKLEEQKIDLEKVGFISASINSINYRNAIVVYQNKEGFSMKTTFMFRLSHPQVFIPWTEIQEIRTKKVMFLKMKELVIGHPFVATIMLDNGTLKRFAIPDSVKVE